MHPTTQFVLASQRRSEREHAAALARTRRELVALRRGRQVAALADAVRGILPGTAVAPGSVCCAA